MPTRVGAGHEEQAVVFQDDGAGQRECVKEEGAEDRGGQGQAVAQAGGLTGSRRRRGMNRPNVPLPCHQYLRGNVRRTSTVSINSFLSGKHLGVNGSD